MAWVEDAKQKAAREAIKPIRNGWVVGVGSGTTTTYALTEIARLAKAKNLNLSVVPTSFQIEHLAISYGLRIQTMNEVHAVDYAIDGADQVEVPSLNLIKGGGGAVLREKIVDSTANRLAIVVDDTKLTKHLGERQRVPLEVMPFAYKTVQVRVTNMGGRARLRQSTEKVGPVVTDNGNLILDADFGCIHDPVRLERGLRMLPGVLETGLFLKMADSVYVGQKNGKVRVIT